MAFFIKPEINKYLSKLTEEGAPKADLPEGSIVIGTTENGANNFSSEQDVMDALEYFTDWKKYYLKTWELLDHSASLEDHVKFLSEQLFDTHELLFKTKPYAAIAGGLNRRMACWSVLLTVIPLLMDNVYKLMEQDGISYEQISGSLEELPSETQVSLEQIFQTATTFIFSHFILIGTKEDISALFHSMLQEYLDIKGVCNESGYDEVINKEACKLYDHLFDAYFSELSGNVIKSENTSENYIIKVTWQDTIVAFLKFLQ